MTKHKPLPWLLNLVFCMCLGCLAGCGSLNMFNSNFLNTFLPFGWSSLNQVEGKGPVTVILENLTKEANHQENAVITINYIDANGVTQTFTPSPLNAVDEDKRDPASADYDPSYKETIILDCGVQEIWVTGTVYRTTISEETQTIDIGNNNTLSITYTTASVIKGKDSEGNTEFTTTEYSSYTANQLPSAHMVVSQHFKCGDVIVIGMMDQQARNGAFVPQTYTATYADINSLPGNAVFQNSNWFYYPPDSTTGIQMLTSQFVPDTNNTLIREEFTYPAGYVLIPIVLPNVSDVENINFTAVNESLEDLAAKYATK
jgi:hypothetical protein